MHELLLCAGPARPAGSLVATGAEFCRRLPQHSSCTRCLAGASCSAVRLAAAQASVGIFVPQFGWPEAHPAASAAGCDDARPAPTAPTPTVLHHEPSPAAVHTRMNTHSAATSGSSLHAASCCDGSAIATGTPPCGGGEAAAGGVGGLACWPRAPPKLLCANGDGGADAVDLLESFAKSGSSCISSMGRIGARSSLPLRFAPRYGLQAATWLLSELGPHRRSDIFRRNGPPQRDDRSMLLLRHSSRREHDVTSESFSSAERVRIVDRGRSSTSSTKLCATASSSGLVAKSAGSPTQNSGCRPSILVDGEMTQQHLKTT
jgi:hypothetical protein